MNVQLDWPLDVVDRFNEEARQARAEAGRSIRGLSKGNVLSPDLTKRDLFEEGRRD